MTKDSQYFYFGGLKLDFTKRLFQAWHDQMTDFEAVLPNDLPYWHAERTNTGILAAAALRLKRTVALEEYLTRRGDGLGADRTGRADLWVYDAHDGWSYDFECKFRYLSFSHFKAELVKSWMSEAARDLASLREDTQRPYMGVAVTFIVPYLLRPPPRLDWAGRWMTFLNFVRTPSHLDADFVAVHQPADEVIENTTDTVEGFNPGIAAVGKIAHRHP